MTKTSALHSRLALRVLVVDDHGIVREGLVRLLGESGISCQQAASAEAALQALKMDDSLDVVLLDLNLPGISGLEAITKMRALRPALKILVLSMHAEAQYGARALRLGASGFVSKSAASAEIQLAVRQVAAGQQCVSPRLAAQVAKGAGAARPAQDLLSDREFQVMRRIGAGKTLAEIGDELGISAKTVSTHRERILAKMDFSGNLEIMRYALQEGILDGAAPLAI